MFNQLLLPDLREMLNEADADALKEFCEALHPAAAAEVIKELAPSESWQVLANCDAQLQAEIFRFIDLPFQVEMVSTVERGQLSKLIEEMPPDDRVDLLNRLDEDRVETLLPLIAQAERADIRKLLSYPEESAGSIMTTEYASLPENITVREAIERLRRQAPERETIYYVFILDEGRHLHGLISLRELILAKPETVLKDVMNMDIISVRVDDDQEVVAHQLGRYDFIAIPVVDNQNRLVGIVTHDDVFDIIHEEATEDAHRLGAVEPLEDSYLTTPLFTIAWKRGIWLVILLGAAIATAAVLNHYENSNQVDSRKYAWMILFLPLVLASGGNAGSQSATLVIRMMAMQKLSGRENLTIAWREFQLALLLGGTLMILGACAAFAFVGHGEAFAVGVTVFLVVLMATVTGAMLPVLFKNLGMDPAMMSNPLIAAMVDVLGVVIYYNVAVVSLEHLF